MSQSTENADQPDLTIILPAFNEEEAIGQVLSETRQAMQRWNGRWDIPVIDDASTDAMVSKCSGAGIRVVRRAKRGGSGAARKTGLLAARGPYVAMLDADASYDPTDLLTLLSNLPEYDLVNGVRRKEMGNWAPLRALIKASVCKFAELLTGRTIHDLNTGMKVFNRDIMLRYISFIPDGFSCVTTMTPALLCNGHSVGFVPINYRPRIGCSKFRPFRDTARYIYAVVRMSTLLCSRRIMLRASLATATLLLLGIYGAYSSPFRALDPTAVVTLGLVTVFAFGRTVCYGRRHPHVQQL